MSIVEDWIRQKINEQKIQNSSLMKPVPCHLSTCCKTGTLTQCSEIMINIDDFDYVYITFKKVSFDIAFTIYSSIVINVKEEIITHNSTGYQLTLRKNGDLLIVQGFPLNSFDNGNTNTNLFTYAAYKVMSNE